MKKILLVEDDKRVALALKTRLCSVGYKVSHALDGELAINMAVNSPPNVILMDINLPGMSGLDVAARLQENKQTCLSPIIFLTASKQRGLSDRAAELGAIAFLEKPINSAKLIEAVEMSYYSTPECFGKKPRHKGRKQVH